MEKYAFRMKLNPGMKDEYRKRHDAIWPELVTLLKADGYPVARRTVTKYRKMLGIASSRQRKVWTE